MSKFRTLHILNKAPEHPRAAMCLSAIDEQDALLLIENGALCLARGDFASNTKLLYALEADVTARALSGRVPGATLIDYSEMVAITAEAEAVISW